MFSKKKKIAIVSNLRFISRKNFMLSLDEHEKSFITSGPGLTADLGHKGAITKKRGL